MNEETKTETWKAAPLMRNRNNIIAFVKHPLGHRIDLNMVRYIPRFFNGTEFNYEAAARKMLTDKMVA